MYIIACLRIEVIAKVNEHCVLRNNAIDQIQGRSTVTRNYARNGSSSGGLGENYLLITMLHALLVCHYVPHIEYYSVFACSTFRWDVI